MKSFEAYRDARVETRADQLRDRVIGIGRGPETHKEVCEDAIVRLPEDRLRIVSDGVSTGGGGAEASLAANEAMVVYLTGNGDDPESVHEAAERLRQQGRPPAAVRELILDRIQEAFMLANQEVLARTRGKTTSALTLLDELPDGKRMLYWGSVGDSRVYVFNRRTKQLEPLSVDDGLLSRRFIAEDLRDLNSISDLRTLDQIRSYRAAAAELADVETAEDLEHVSFPDAFFDQRIYQSLGSHPPPIVQRGTRLLEKDDVIFVTSDGVHDNLTRDELVQLLSDGDDERAIEARIQKQAFLIGQKQEEHFQKDRIRRKPDDISASVEFAYPSEPAREVSSPTQMELPALIEIEKEIQEAKHELETLASEQMTGGRRAEEIRLERLELAHGINRLRLRRALLERQEFTRQLQEQGGQNKDLESAISMRIVAIDRLRKEDERLRKEVARLYVDHLQDMADQKAAG